jgi:hypothetical protein
VFCIELRSIVVCTVCLQAGKQKEGEEEGGKKTGEQREAEGIKCWV